MVEQDCLLAGQATLHALRQQEEHFVLSEALHLVEGDRPELELVDVLLVVCGGLHGDLIRSRSAYDCELNAGERGIERARLLSLLPDRPARRAKKPQPNSEGAKRKEKSSREFHNSVSVNV